MKSEEASVVGNMTALMSRAERGVVLFVDGVCPADRAILLLRKPLIDAIRVEIMAAIEPDHLARLVHYTDTDAALLLTDVNGSLV